MDDRSAAEVRFASVFAHLGLISAYARRRGANDPDALAAETMAIAWRRLADVPTDDSRPWLIATARNTQRKADRGTFLQMPSRRKSSTQLAPTSTPIPIV